MHLRGQLHRSFASLRMTVWIYATNLWDTTLACVDQSPDMGQVVVIVLCHKVQMVH